MILESERVILASPMSLVGSAERLWRVTRHGRAWWSRALIVTAVLLVITVAWALVLCWYALFGLWLVPYRIIRRGQRKRRRDALRHAELLARFDAELKPYR